MPPDTNFPENNYDGESESDRKNHRILLHDKLIQILLLIGLVIAITVVMFSEVDRESLADLHAALNRQEERLAAQEKLLAAQQEALSQQSAEIRALPGRIAELQAVRRSSDISAAGADIADKLKGQGGQRLDGGAVLEKLFPLAGKLLRKGLSEEEFIAQFVAGATQELGAAAVRGLIEAPLKKLGGYFYDQMFGSDTDPLLAELAALQSTLAGHQKDLAALASVQETDQKAILQRLGTLERLLRESRGLPPVVATTDGPLTERKIIYFPLGKMKGPSVDKALDALTPWLKNLEAHYKCKLLVAGHADSTGPEDRNKFVANARAKYVADYLNSKGFNVDYVSGWGERRQEKLTGDNVPEPLNRRAVITATCEEKSVAANLGGTGNLSRGATRDP